MPGFTVAVSPSSFTLLPGQTQTFTVALTSAGAFEGQWNYGALVWTDGTHTVRSPVTVRAGKTIVSPALVTATTVSGARLMTVENQTPVAA